MLFSAGNTAPGKCADTATGFEATWRETCGLEVLAKKRMGTSNTIVRMKNIFPGGLVLFYGSAQNSTGRFFRADPWGQRPEPSLASEATLG